MMTVYQTGVTTPLTPVVNSGTRAGLRDVPRDPSDG
jgi:hypothetical protein